MQGRFFFAGNNLLNNNNNNKAKLYTAPNSKKSLGTVSLLPITSSQPHASASDSTFDYWRYINI